MQLERDDLAAVVQRLRRAQGQIGGILTMIDQQRECVDIVTQVAAVSKALDRAGFAIIAQGMRECLSDPAGQELELELAELEKLFLSLA